jgi:ribosomal protein S24E
LPYSDVLHPNRANVSKDELRGKLGELYKAKKEDVSVFGFKTHFGGGKSTGFALIYDSAEAMKKFEPRYRLVRYGMATKVEKASRQQRTFLASPNTGTTVSEEMECITTNIHLQPNRQAAQEQDEGVPWYRQDQGWCEEGQEISASTITMTTKVMVGAERWLLWNWFAWYLITTARMELQRASACTAMNA